ncbi:MAG: RNA polymerase sigma factor [Pseudonocardia sp.]
MTTLARDEPLAPAVTAGVSAEDRLAEVAPMVRRMCTARLGPWDGEDAAQEALLRVWQLQQCPEYAEAAQAAPVFGWASMNARWAVFRSARDSSRRAVPAGQLSEQLWIDPQAGPEERALRLAEVRAARDQLGELIPQLSLRERQVILASQFGARSNVETAARLGISREAAAVAKQNAIARMRELTGVVAPAVRAERRAAQYRDSAQGRAAAARRDDQQAALVAAAQRLPAAVSTDGAGRGVGTGTRWPEEVHRAGRAAVRDGWNRADLIREFGVSADLVHRWQRATAPDAGEPAGPSMEALIARAHQAVADAQQRRAEVEAHARVFGTPRGKGQVPEIVEAKAREAARRGWTPAEMEHAFAVHRATAKRWIAQETAAREERGTGAEERTDAHRTGRSNLANGDGQAVGDDEADAAEPDAGPGEDPMEQARHAVAALPAPAAARAAVEEREQLEQAPVAGPRHLLAEYDGLTEHDGDADTADRGPDRDADAWGAA